MKDNEIVGAKKDELQNGQMKEVVWDEKKIVLAKVDDEYYAVGGVCPHYKAPLVKGALCGTRLYCPWHHSSFDITNGQLCDPPAIDGLPRYQIRVENDDVIIEVPELKPETSANKTSIDTDKTFVIVGGGAAGLMTAETLRGEGFAGRLILITKEDKLPYDRTALSKKFMSGEAKTEELPLRKDDFFKQHNIELQTEKKVEKIEVSEKEIRFTDGSSLPFDKLLVATGGEPNPPTIEGSQLSNVLTLRSLADAETILETAKQAKKAVVIGASFIAMEMAASLKTLGLTVTVLAKEGLPFEKNFGEEIGQMFVKLHEEKGIIIKTNSEVEKIEGNDKAEGVILKNGDRIETQLVVVGIGVHPVTDILDGVNKDDKDKSILADEYLQAAEHVFVAGDIAKYPDPQGNQPVRIEHWRLAQQHGRIAALNMLGKKASVSGIVPFFWTNQFDKRLSYVGHAKEWDEIVVDGNVAEQKFVALYVKDNRVLAAASMNRDVESNQIEDLMRHKKHISVEDANAILHAKSSQ